MKKKKETDKQVAKKFAQTLKKAAKASGGKLISIKIK